MNVEMRRDEVSVAAYLAGTRLETHLHTGHVQVGLAAAAAGERHAAVVAPGAMLPWWEARTSK